MSTPTTLSGRAHVGVVAALAVLTLAAVGSHGMSAFAPPLGVCWV